MNKQEAIVETKRMNNLWQSLLPPRTSQRGRERCTHLCMDLSAFGLRHQLAYSYRYFVARQYGRVGRALARLVDWETACDPRLPEIFVLYLLAKLPLLYLRLNGHTLHRHWWQWYYTGSAPEEPEQLEF